MAGLPPRPPRGRRSPGPPPRPRSESLPGVLSWFFGSTYSVFHAELHLLVFVLQRHVTKLVVCAVIWAGLDHVS